MKGNTAPSPDQQKAASLAALTADDQETIRTQFSRIRQDSLAICEPLEIEDHGIQTMPDVSPPKWHLAHTSWFFETFLLKPYLPRYRDFHPQFAELFNSYYNSIGQYHPRPQRGFLSRPILKDVIAYRSYVNEQMLRLIEQVSETDQGEVLRRTILGLNHEQQHQELMLTDIKHIFASNPLRPRYRELAYPQATAAEMRWLDYHGGILTLGHQGESFSYDNEGPAHKVYVNDFQLANRAVSNGEMLEFINDGGYQNPALWLSDAWKTVCTEQWTAPLYWENRNPEWWHMTLGGLRPVDLQAPVCHISYYEADAFARWAGKRLPTEVEWEIAARQTPITGNLRDSDFLQPAPAGDAPGLQQAFGDVWEWTQSPYIPYPGYRQQEGAFGEYNGKFMSNQIVLRGGSCVTPPDHIRASYRNFFYPADRWQFSGLRLAQDAL